MTSRSSKRSFVFVAALAVSSATSLATGARALAAPTKDACVEAHGAAQDAREKGRLVEARKQFLTCAQAACPALVQADCARAGEDLSRTVPSISVVTRDADGNDLVGGQTYVDGALVPLDGKAVELDPGKHVVRFVYQGREVSRDVQLAIGERGRLIIGVIPAAPSSTLPGTSTPSLASADGATAPVAPAPTSEPSRPVWPLVVAGVGGAAFVAGGVLVLVGKGNIPSRCELSTHSCKAQIGDPRYDAAKSAVSTMNIGFVTGGVGVAVAVTSVALYFAQSPRTTAGASPPTWTRVSPSVAKGVAGLSYEASF